jgi:hypothetical protein
VPLRLEPAEVTYLAGYLGRLRSWDEWAAVRLQVRGAVVGVYGALPMGALALIVLPLALAHGDNASDGHDETVLAGRLRDILGDVSPATDVSVREIRLPDPVSAAGALTRLPPRGGWSPGKSGRAGDLSPQVAAAVARYRAEVPAGGSLMADLVASQAWDGPGWGGVPLAGLRAASLLGFLAHAEAPVRTASTSGWCRLVTPAGQVFVPRTDRPADNAQDMTLGDRPPSRD